MLIQAFCIGDFFSCVLKIELQSTRVHMYEIKVFEWWVIWLVLDSDGFGEAGTGFLITRLVIIFLFLVKTRGATLADVCLRLEADWSKSGWTNIITFFIGGDPLQKSTSGAVGRKWNLSQVLVVGSGPFCCCWQRKQDYPRERDIEFGGNKVNKFSTSSSGIMYSGSICCSRGPRTFLKTWVFHMFHQVLKPIDEEVKDRSAGIGMWRSSNML